MKAGSPVQGTRPKRNESDMDRTSCELLLLDTFLLVTLGLPGSGSPRKPFKIWGCTELDTRPPRESGTPLLSEYALVAAAAVVAAKGHKLLRRLRHSPYCSCRCRL